GRAARCRSPDYAWYMDRASPQFGPQLRAAGSRSGRIRRALLCVIAVGLAACSGGASASPSPSVLVVGGGQDLIPVVVNAEFGVGHNHFVFTIVDASNNSVAAPDRTARVAFAPLGATGSASTAEAQFVWGIEGSKGFYVTDVTFPSAGNWQAGFLTAGPGETETEISGVQFEVKDKTSAIAVGQKAPATRTPTLADVGGDPRKISSDANPDPRFYQVSEDQALREHKPFVLVFATPAFCTSRECGPTLDRVKTIAAGYPDLTFINVEPYKLAFSDGKLQPVLDSNSQLQATDVTNAWGILSEPWVYVVGADGVVRASFETVFSETELRAAIDGLN
ncbi:MAG TPA: hypothetical protein VIV06_09445, partial [Candidatus Limnocylindrales bacterium]